MRKQRRREHTLFSAAAILWLLLAAPPAIAGSDMVGDIEIIEGTVQVGDQTYRVQSTSRIYDERNRLIQLAELSRLADATYSQDGLVLMGDVAGRLAADGRLDLVELHVDVEEDE